MSQQPRRPSTQGERQASGGHRKQRDDQKKKTGPVQDAPDKRPTNPRSTPAVTRADAQPPAATTRQYAPPFVTAKDTGIPSDSRNPIFPRGQPVDNYAIIQPGQSREQSGDPIGKPKNAAHPEAMRSGVPNPQMSTQHPVSSLETPLRVMNISESANPNATINSVQHGQPHGPTRPGSGSSPMSSHPPETMASPVPRAPTGPSTYQSTLDPRYVVRPSSYYRVGRVFSVLKHDNLSEGAPQRPNRTLWTVNVSVGPHGEKIYTTTRRMVVVREAHGYCVCVQISTYGGRGLGKFSHGSAEVQAHSRIYMSGTPAQWVNPNEPRTQKLDVAVTPAASDQTLTAASRICYLRPHSIEHNEKTMDVGFIEPEYIEYVKDNFRAEQQI